MKIVDGECFESNIYFGTGYGAQHLYRSLFTWDFNRYIIGTNSSVESHTYIKDGQKVLLYDITNAVAYRIKKVYKYSQVLSDYDDHVQYELSSFEEYRASLSIEEQERAKNDETKAE